MAVDYFETKLSVLMKEWDYCQTHIGRFDTIIFGIRGWAITAVSAILGVAFSKPMPVLVLLAVFPVFMFWLIDALNRTIQRRFLGRVIEIERYFQSEAFRWDIASDTFQQFESPVGFTSYIKKRRKKQVFAVVREAFRPSVVLVYGSIFVIGLVCYFRLNGCDLWLRGWRFFSCVSD
ncbi:hypothetical protein [Rhodopila sp.]|uniref:hypothetical protein n=1 Tax=Rhodopila sp. TaxID=2480087 RepID=UPI003D0FB289